MNFDLSDEQLFLVETARGALAGHPTVSNARAALDGAPLLDLWPVACELGWTGIAAPPERGGAGLGALEAALLMLECGRVLAPLPLSGHIVATDLIGHADGGSTLLDDLAAGQRRAAVALAQPPNPRGIDGRWISPDGRCGDSLRVVLDGDTAVVNGSLRSARDVVGSDAIVAIAVTDAGDPVAVVLNSHGPGVTGHAQPGFDATCPLDRLELVETRGTVLSTDRERCARAWYLGQMLLAGESLGTAEAALQMSLAYAKDRTAFGRQIGSYQAVKHLLVEMLRLQENARSLIYYAGWAFQDAPDEIPLAASAARVATIKALDFSAREAITIHGGSGVTWEHDAPLYFRRAQVCRLLAGGLKTAAIRVGEITIESARSHSS
jgi:alkylation response protein AidB-like acyl-CoA dehydrogenase